MTATHVRRAPSRTTGPHDPAGRSQRRAWISLALVPVALAAAMVVGEGLIAAQGFEVHADQAPPLVPTLLAAVPALLVGVSAPLAAVWFGLQARRRGVGRGLVVAIAGGFVGVAFVALNVAAALVDR